MFRVKKVLKNLPIVRYELEDIHGEEVLGSFFENELVPFKGFDYYNYPTEVIDSKGKGKNKQLLVRYTGWPDKYNEWIPAEKLKNIEKKQTQNKPQNSNDIDESNDVEESVYDDESNDINDEEDSIQNEEKNVIDDDQPVVNNHREFYEPFINNALKKSKVKVSTPQTMDEISDFNNQSSKKRVKVTVPKTHIKTISDIDIKKDKKLKVAYVADETKIKDLTKSTRINKNKTSKKVSAKKKKVSAKKKKN